MDSRVLSYVVAVAETGSFSAAARRCLVAQPSLSRQIAGLERELGEPLFVRGRDGASPTEAGRALLPHARTVRTAIADARAVFAERAGRIEGELRIGVVAGLDDTALPEAVARLSHQHGGLRITVTGGAGHALIEGVIEHRWDAAVVVSEIDPLPAGLVASTLLTEHVVAVHAPEAFPVAEHSSPFHERDLGSTPVITYGSRSEVGRLLSLRLGAIVDDAFCRTDDQGLQMALAAQGAGTALTAGSGSVRAQRGRLVVRPFEPAIRFRKRLVRRADAVASPAMRALLAELARTEGR